jgi:hypothetical protein
MYHLPEALTRTQYFKKIQNHFLSDGIFSDEAAQRKTQ